MKRAFVTGAAGGLGLEICRVLAADGWTIGMADINVDQLNAACDLITNAGGKPVAFELDVADSTAYARVADEFVSVSSGIDVLVNNAGVGDYGYVHTYGIENWHWLMGINLMGTIHGCCLFVPHIIKQGHGAVLNVASAAAFSSLPRMGAYNVSKAGVVSLSETLDAELHDKGITVSVLKPTFFKTAIMQHGRNRVEDEVSRYIFGSTTLMPDRVAAIFLDRAARGRFRTVLPADARLMYLIRRFSPWLGQLIGRMAERHSLRIAEQLRRRYEKKKRKGQVDETFINRLFGEGG